MNKKEKLAFAVVAVLAMSSGGFAVAAYKDNFVSSNQVIYACVTGVNGNITKVSNTPKTCPRGTTPISWNMVGPKGEQGIQGTTGSQGLPGPKGDRGVDGKLEPALYLQNQDVSLKVTYDFAGSWVLVDNRSWSFAIENGKVSFFGRATWDVSPLDAVLYSSYDCKGESYIFSTKPMTSVTNAVIAVGGKNVVFDSKSMRSLTFENMDVKSVSKGNICQEILDKEALTKRFQAEKLAFEIFKSNYYRYPDRVEFNWASESCLEDYHFQQGFVWGRDGECDMDWSRIINPAGVLEPWYISLAPELIPAAVNPNIISSSIRYLYEADVLETPSLPSDGWYLEHR